MAVVIALPRPKIVRSQLTQYERSLNIVQLTPEQRTFVIKTFYETYNSLQQARVAFGLNNFA